jgi:hypothetical protein
MSKLEELLTFQMRRKELTHLKLPPRIQLSLLTKDKLKQTRRKNKKKDLNTSRRKLLMIKIKLRKFKLRRNNPKLMVLLLRI